MVSVSVRCSCILVVLESPSVSILCGFWCGFFGLSCLLSQVTFCAISWLIISSFCSMMFRSFCLLSVASSVCFFVWLFSWLFSSSSLVSLFSAAFS